MAALPIDDPATYNFEASTNSDFEQFCSFQDQNRDAISLEGSTLRMDIKSAPGGTTWLSLTSASLTANGSGLVVSTPATGEFTIQIDRDDLAAMPFAGKTALIGTYDVIVTDSSAVARRFLKGDFSVVVGVTIP